MDWDWDSLLEGDVILERGPPWRVYLVTASSPRRLDLISLCTGKAAWAQVGLPTSRHLSEQYQAIRGGRWMA